MSPSVDMIAASKYVSNVTQLDVSLKCWHLVSCTSTTSTFESLHIFGAHDLTKNFAFRS